MSEPYSMTVSFTTNNSEHMADIAELFEHFDTDEEDEARKILQRYNLADAQKSINRLTEKDSDYNNHDDLVEMYIENANEDIDEFKTIFNKSNLSGAIEIEGYDYGMPESCSALVLVLMACGVNNINAEASSILWSAKWANDTKGNLRLTFKEEG